MNCYSFPLRCFKKVILRLCENSDLIYEIFTLGKRGVTWRMRLLAWEEESVTECVALLHNIVLQDHIIHDRWRWLLDPITGYSVKGTYHFLTTMEVPSYRVLFDDVWHRQVPLKVSMLLGDCFVIDF